MQHLGGRVRLDAEVDAPGLDSLQVEEPVLLRRVKEVQGDRPYVLTQELLEQVNGMPEFVNEPFNERTLGIAMTNLGHPSQPINRDKQRGKRGYDVKGDEGQQ